MPKTLLNRPQTIACDYCGGLVDVAPLGRVPQFHASCREIMRAAFAVGHARRELEAGHDRELGVDVGELLRQVNDAVQA